MAALRLLPAWVGLGWRPEIAGVLGGLPGLRWCEVVAENIRPDRLPEPLARLAQRGVAIVPHGVTLSLGGAERPEPDRVDHLARCARALSAPLVSEHVAFVRAGGVEAGHLLPVPRTREMLGILVENVRAAQGRLDVALALEPIAALVEWPESELTEGQFLTDLLERTDALLLLDIANVYANARNRGGDAVADLHSMPLERVAYCHVAGGVERDGLYHDSHTQAVPADVLELVTVALEMMRHRGAEPAVLLERDDHYPPEAELRGELDLLADAAGYGRVT